jgi:4-hydroxysphinganine ceramide fatty acyl 2-hydroxylase
MQVIKLSLLYTNIVIYLIYISYQSVTFFEFILLFILGIIFWTLIEYSFHRYSHITSARLNKENSITGFAKSLFYDIDDHHHHHYDPSDDRELHYTFFESFFICIFGIFISRLYHKQKGLIIAAGYIQTYVFYEWVHLASHKELNIKWLNYLTRHHKEHHRLENGNNLGFITSFWDRVFNTYNY